MAIGPKGPPQKPGLSIRGRVIFDTVRGVPRVRPWPPKKPTKPGTKRNLTAKAFGAANRACKVTASTFYGEHWSATRGTPLLPRDLMIAMMYGRAFALTLEDGRIIRSVASRNDVSKSLDMIGQAKNSVLIRGDKYWETQDRSTIGGYEVILETVITSPIPEIIIPFGVDVKTLSVFVYNLSSSVSTGRGLQVSTDGGNTYYDQTGDYTQTGTDNVTGTFHNLALISGSTAAARTAHATFIAPQLNMERKLVWIDPRPNKLWTFEASPDPITHARLLPPGGGNLTGGYVLVLKE